MDRLYSAQLKNILISPTHTAVKKINIIIYNYLLKREIDRYQSQTKIMLSLIPPEIKHEEILPYLDSASIFSLKIALLSRDISKEDFNKCLTKSIFLHSLSFVQYYWNYIKDDENIEKYAVKYGSIEIIEWLHQTYDWNEESVLWAIQKGRLNILRWLRKNGCRFNKKSFSYAAKYGHLHILNYLERWKGNRQISSSYKYDACNKAAEYGQLDCLKWLKARDFPCFEHVCDNAAKKGHLHILVWARSLDPPCPWSETTSYLAAKEGHLHILEWMYHQDPPCPWSERITTNAVYFNNGKLLEWLKNKNHPSLWNDDLTCSTSLDMLKWLRNLNPPCPWSEYTLINAATKRDWDLFIWAREHGCPWNEKTCAAIASTRNLNMLQWSVERDCPWNEKTCSEAAAHGYLDILQWARERGCPWNEKTVAKALTGGYMDIFNWAKEQGCSYNEKYCIEELLKACGEIDWLIQEYYGQEELEDLLAIKERLTKTLKLIDPSESLQNNNSVDYEILELASFM